MTTALNRKILFAYKELPECENELGGRECMSLHARVFVTEWYAREQIKACVFMNDCFDDFFGINAIVWH
jgi:hypothetical protein